jgi:D-glycero-D-manno-heptose 1,7-bisphosphate phosphatase
MTASPAVFLDRDGTLLHEVGYLSRREDVRWFPFSVDAVRLLKRAAFRVYVMTNQGGIGLGMFPEAFVQQTHAEMAAHLEAAGARVDGWFYCPHHPRARVPALAIDCDCRKPKPGLIRQAERQHPIDLARSFVVGDKHVDVELASGVGARGILVQTGHGAAELARQGGQMPGAAFVATDLMEATSWILRHA